MFGTNRSIFQYITLPNSHSIFHLLNYQPQRTIPTGEEGKVKELRDSIIIRREYLVSKQRELGLTNFECAEKLDISLRQYTRILDGIRGRCLSAVLMEKICQVFSISEKDLLRLEAEFQSKFIEIKRIKEAKQASSIPGNN